MTNDQYELLEMIRNSKDPEQAILTALGVIIDYLTQHESSATPSDVAIQEHD